MIRLDASDAPANAVVAAAADADDADAAADAASDDDEATDAAGLGNCCFISQHWCH